MDPIQILTSVFLLYIICLVVTALAPKSEVGEFAEETKGTITRLFKLGKGGLKAANKGLDGAIEQLENEANAK